MADISCLGGVPARAIHHSFHSHERCNSFFVFLFAWHFPAMGSASRRTQVRYGRPGPRSLSTRQSMKRVLEAWVRPHTALTGDAMGDTVARISYVYFTLLSPG